MIMNWITLLGVVAGILTTISFLPQVIKAWKTKQTKDISLGMYSIFVSGVALWLVYGFAINDLPVILANAVTLVLAGFVLLMKIKYK
jgi:MtN3 and saliva related transmembrane protein